ncbi:MAG: DUF1566 domain-containing protein, partial [Desulfobacterales bacterium]|nr:DUF1566 domain-containing protein [Desulfobacterales bacterium]
RLLYAPLPYTGPSTIGRADMANNASVSATLWDGASFAVAVQAYNDSGDSPLSNIEQVLIDMNAVDYQLADTGITQCYDNSEEIACPAPGQPFYGQDAQYDGPGSNYQDNGAGVVADLNTGLFWQRDGEGAYGDLQESIDYCESLVLDGEDDWRLPSVGELVSIVDPSRADPAIDPVFPCVSSGYWSRTANFDYFSSDNTWCVLFSSGSVISSKRRYGNYARCVRGETPDKSYMDNGDGSVTDSITGLMWQQGSSHDDAGSLTWRDALAYCEDLALGEKTDWRLANLKELVSILYWSPNILSITPTAIDPVFSCHPFGYWSGSTSASRADRAWRVDFRDGSRSAFDKESHYYARCVRDGPGAPR